MPDAARELIRLAMERFGNLLPAEAKMLRAAAEGTVADVADQEGEQKLTRESAWGCWEKWGEHRKIRAEVLRWVLVDEEATGLVHEHGVPLRHARVEGRVDLRGAVVRSQIVWEWSAIPDGVDVMRASVPLLSLGGSHVGGITGDRVNVAGSVFLGGGMVAKGEVRLPGAKIGGDLQLQGLDCDGNVDLDRSVVEGTFQLDDATDVKGSFDLSDARVARLHDAHGAWTDRTRLNLNGFRYGSFTDECDMGVEDRIEWIRRGMTNAERVVVYSPQPYQQLAGVLVATGREQDAAKVRVAQFCARREQERPRGLSPLHGWAIWLWRGLVYWTLEYGYARARPLAIMIVLWLLSSAVFSYAGTHGMMVPASDQVLTSKEYWEDRAIPPDYQRFNSLVFAADSMLPIIDLHQERFWLPNPQATWLRAWLWTHIVLGWMFSTLLAVGMSGLLRDEDEEATASDS